MNSQPNTDLNKVATLIHKLLALSKDGGATEAEARLAAEKAQQLMTEHNLSMASVEASGGSSGAEGQRVKDGLNHRQVYKWQRSLMAALAELNFCYCTEKFEWRGGSYSNTRVFDGYELIGRAANVASTRIMFEYLLQTIDRLAKADVEDPSQFFTRYAHSFKEGCSDRVVERLQEQRREEIREQERRAAEEKARATHPAYAGSNALVVVLGDYVQDEHDLNEDYRKGLPPGTTKARREEYEREAEEYRAKRAAARAEKRAQLLQERPELAQDEQRLDYLVSGWSDESIDKLFAPAKPLRPETDAQRRKREEREERAWQREQRRQSRENARLDMRGYSSGFDKGDEVSLNRQIDENSKGRLA